MVIHIMPFARYFEVVWSEEVLCLKRAKNQNRLNRRDRQSNFEVFFSAPIK